MRNKAKAMQSQHRYTRINFLRIVIGAFCVICGWIPLLKYRRLQLIVGVSAGD